MNRKRSLVEDSGDSKKRKLECEKGTNNTKHKRSKKLPLDAAPTDTESALSYLASIFPSEKFNNKFPPIIWRHQIYSFVKSKLEVNKKLNELREKGEVRLFRLGGMDETLAVVYTKDYISYVESCCPNSQRVGRFLKKVVTQDIDYTFNSEYLREQYRFLEADLIEMVQEGVLTRRDIKGYWMSIPRVSEFMKAFVYGSRAMLQIVKRTKYKEILQSELIKRKLPKKAILGTMYHMYDMIGRDAVTCIETSTGIMLRLRS